MLRGGPASLLLRLAQRAPLARVALPLLAAYAPEAFSLRGARARGLHVFARAGAHEDFCKVEVRDGAAAGDLKKAVIAELQLGAPPNRVRLLREVEGGGAPVPLDSLRALAEQGVREGTRVLIEVLPPPPPPPPPALPYVLVRESGYLSPTKVAFARGADADDLKKAVIAELRLDAAPNRVSLLREVEGGGAPVPLDSGGLAAQGVGPGARVLVLVLPAPRRSRSLSAPLEAFPNVLAPAPDGAHSPQLLQLLSSPGTGAQERVGALSALLLQRQQRHPSAEPLPLPLFETQAHQALLGTLVSHASRLASGSFTGVNGGPCRTLVGARGIGKTAILRAFAHVAASAFPSVVTLYVSCAGLRDTDSSFREAGLPGLIEAAAAARGTAAPLGAGGVGAALRARGLRLLLLLDEVDELYTVSAAEPALCARVLETLGRLGSLGDGFSGQFGVLLCGSSSSTYSLVCGGAPGLGEWFPLLKQGAPDLNSDKYSCLVVPSSPCTAVGEVARMLAALAQAPQGVLPQALLPQARLFAFFVGASPRAVVRALRDDDDDYASALASATPVPSPRLSLRAAALYLALLAKLVERNGALRASVRSRSDGAVNLVCLMDGTVPWEDLLVPLTWHEVEGVWAATAGAAAGDAALLRHLVHELADHQLFLLRGTFLCDEALWPVTVVQVAASGGEQRDWARDAVPRLRELLGLVAGLRRQSFSE